MRNKIFNTIKLGILVVAIFACSSNTMVLEAKVVNNNLNKTVNLTTMAMKVNEFDNDALYSAKDTYTGDLTGYVYNCPACTGRLACLSGYDLSTGVTTYQDADYGEVRIVASSTNLECGSIIRFKSERISDEPIYAIVLDRGVVGNSLDLLVPTTDYAISTIGRTAVTYDVLRNGWTPLTYES